MCAVVVPEGSTPVDEVRVRTSCGPELYAGEPTFLGEGLPVPRLPEAGSAPRRFDVEVPVEVEALVEVEAPADAGASAKPAVWPESALPLCEPVSRECAFAFPECEPEFPFSELALSPDPDPAESEASRPSEFFEWSVLEEDRASL